MENKFTFTFDYIEKQFEEVLQNNYSIITCEQFIEYKKNNLSNKIVVNRVDIDLSVKKTLRLVNLFNKLNIKASFFVRLHAPEYNPFSFENYRILKHIRDTGHEIGYHSEVIDQAAIWNEDAKECLIRDIEILNRMLGIKIRGVASHGGMTGLNNLDFWKDRKASEFGLLYEAYDKELSFNLFQESFYVSDSEWLRWKCYDKGKLVEGNRKSLAEHSKDGHQIIHSLIHPDTYFDNHFYDNEK